MSSGEVNPSWQPTTDHSEDCRVGGRLEPGQTDREPGINRMMCTREPAKTLVASQDHGCFQPETMYQGNIGNDMGMPTIGYRSARYNLPEWEESNYMKFCQSAADQDNAERVRTATQDLMNEGSTLCRVTQDASTMKLAARLKDIHFWKSELEREIFDLRSETDELEAQKRRLERALRACDSVLLINTDNLNCRERRECTDLAQDYVELNLLKELDVANNVMDLLKKTIREAEKQIVLNRERKYELESDWSDKKETDDIDTFNVGLRNEHTNKQFHPAAAVFQEIQSTAESWAQRTHDNIVRAEHERMASIQLRTLIDNILLDTSRDLREQCHAVEIAFSRRAEQMSDTLAKMTSALKKTVDDIGKTEKLIAELRDLLKNNENIMKVAQTRLYTRAERPNVDMCRDPVHYHLVGEVHQISRNTDAQLQKLNDCEQALKDLQDQRLALEKEVAYKTNSIFIDRKQCMTHRTPYPNNQRLLGYQ